MILICNAFQLQLMGNVDFEENVNILSRNENLDAYFELGADIDASITSSWNSGNGFIPIGAFDTDYYGIGTSAGFSGSFHGNNYTIDGLFINRSRDTVGMFGVIAPFAVVTNVRITNIDVTQNDTGSDQSAGAIAGRLYSHLRNIYLQGSVSGDQSTGGVVGISADAALKNIHANMSVTGDNQTGGMIGVNTHSLIVNSFLQGTVIGEVNTGGMTGYSRGLVDYVNPSTTIIFSSVNANISGNNEVGGFIGRGFYGNLSDHSFFSGNVNGNNDVGGLIGSSLSLTAIAKVKNSFSNGSIVSTGTDAGGLIGASYSFEIENSFSHMNITSSGSSVGGLVGNKGGVDLIRNSFASGTINNPGFGISGGTGSGLSNVYWFDAGVNVSDCYNLGNTNCNNNGAPTSEAAFYSPSHGVYVDGAINWDFDHIWQAHSNDLPSLRPASQASTGLIGQGLEKDPFLIGSVLEWNLIKDNSYLMGSYFRLTSDLNFSGANCASMIGSSKNHFLGVIDGDGFTISNFSCDANTEALIDLNHIGLIRSGTAAEIKNLELLNFAIDTSGANVGALVGRCSNCFIENISEFGSVVNGASSTGGLVGAGSKVSIQNSFASGDVSGTFSNVGGLIGNGSSANIQNSFVSGSVSGTFSVGGLIGSGNSANIQNSFASGDVNGDDGIRRVSGLIGSSNSNTSISDSFFIGSISNSSEDPNAITNNSNATFINVYWDETAISDCHEAGIFGCNVETDQTQFYLQTHPVYNRAGFNWDFTNIWQENLNDFPVLR